MSFRNTFVTDFIYQAAEDVVDANSRVTDVLQKYSTSLDHIVDKRGYGYYAGVIGDTAYGSEVLNLEQMVMELRKATKVPFRLTIMIESGPQITYEVTPRT